jgi:hypothetical protein
MDPRSKRAAPATIPGRPTERSSTYSNPHCKAVGNPRVSPERVDPAATWAKCPSHGVIDSPIFVMRIVENAGRGVGACCPHCKTHLGWVRQKPVATSSITAAQDEADRSSDQPEQKATRAPIGGRVAFPDGQENPNAGQVKTPNIVDGSTKSQVHISTEPAERLDTPITVDEYLREKPRRQKRPKVIPTETPESLRLWQYVSRQSRLKALHCRRCQTDPVPVLYRKGNHIGALCPRCGSFIKFMGQNAAEHDEPTRASNWRRWLAEEEEQGYKSGYALASFKSSYGFWPPWAWSQPEWVAAGEVK